LQIDFKYVLLYRSFLLHWGLFLVKDSQSGLESFLSLAFERNYFTLIDGTFEYIWKYLVVLSIITKSKTSIKTLRNSFSSLHYEDAYTKLFNSIFVLYEDTECAFKNVRQISELLKKDFFLSSYEFVFLSKCKEIIIENSIRLNNTIDLVYLAKNFGESEEETKKALTDYIITYHPDLPFKFEGSILKINLSSIKNETKVNIY
jgi:hypothetical protein